jgi:hypothetical protein
VVEGDGNSTLTLDITHAVMAFRSVLICSWPHLVDLSRQDRTGSFLDDFLQSTWERIVEASVDPKMNIVLEPYGEGADCNLRSSRVWKPNSLPNAEVHANYIGNDHLFNVADNSEVKGNLLFDRFCTLDNNWPVHRPPFDYAALGRDGGIVVACRDLRYFVRGTELS